MTARLLFVYREPAPFVQADRALLARHYTVIDFSWHGRKHPARDLASWMLRNRDKYDIVFVWFGDSHATVATLASLVARRPTVIQVGGYDVSDLADYGFLARRRNQGMARVHFRLAARIFAVSDELAKEVARRFPSAEPKIRVLPTGVDSSRFRPQGLRRQQVLSVAFVDTWRRAWIKGWDLLAAAAREAPDISFLLIGASDSVRARLAGPKNLEVRGPVKQGDLVSAYQASVVYAQPSRTEGLPNALLEAMASGCVPVVTRIGGMTNLVEGTGFVVEEEPAAIARAIADAIRSPEIGDRARARVVEQYPLAKRERRLREQVEQVLSRRLSDLP